MTRAIPIGLPAFNRKMSFHFPRVFPLISDLTDGFGIMKSTQNQSLQNVFRPSLKYKPPAFSNSSCLESVSEKLHFCDGLVWTVRLTVGIKLLFKFIRRSENYKFK